DFQHVAVGIVEIDAASAAPVVDVAVGARTRPAAVGNARGLDPGKDRVELGLADPAGVMVRLELAALVQIGGPRLVDRHGGKRQMRPLAFETKDAGEDLGRGDLVASRDDRMVEGDRHRYLLRRESKRPARRRRRTGYREFGFRRSRLRGIETAPAAP